MRILWPLSEHLIVTPRITCYFWYTQAPKNSLTLNSAFHITDLPISFLPPLSPSFSPQSPRLLFYCHSHQDAVSTGLSATVITSVFDRHLHTQVSPGNRVLLIEQQSLMCIVHPRPTPLPSRTCAPFCMGSNRGDPHWQHRTDGRLRSAAALQVHPNREKMLAPALAALHTKSASRGIPRSGLNWTSASSTISDWSERLDRKKYLGHWWRGRGVGGHRNTLGFALFAIDVPSIKCLCTTAAISNRKRKKSFQLGKMIDVDCGESMYIWRWDKKKDLEDDMWSQPADTVDSATSEYRCSSFPIQLQLWLGATHGMKLDCPGCWVQRMFQDLGRPERY